MLDTPIPKFPLIIVDVLPCILNTPFASTTSFESSWPTTLPKPRSNSDNEFKLLKVD